MQVTKLITSIALKMIVCVIIPIVVLSLLNNPILNNTIALGQMENSNELYILMEAYNQATNYLTFVCSCTILCFIVSTIFDIHNFISTKDKGEN